jgi:hypothetical protein
MTLLIKGGKWKKYTLQIGKKSDNEIEPEPLLIYPPPPSEDWITPNIFCPILRRQVLSTDSPPVLCIWVMTPKGGLARLPIGPDSIWRNHLAAARPHCLGSESGPRRLTPAAPALLPVGGGHRRHQAGAGRPDPPAAARRRGRRRLHRARRQVGYPPPYPPSSATSVYSMLYLLAGSWRPP